MNTQDFTQNPPAANQAAAPVKLPEILAIPPKMLPMVTEFNNYRYFLGDGGRGSGKTHSVARFLLFLAGVQKLRIVCGREIQKNIEESVYTVLKDLIEQYNLPYQVQAQKITHLVTKSTFTFKGFREQGSVSIKGLEGVDVLWIDEAQSVTELTLQTLIPTIRKNKARLFFTMNRHLRDDAVYTFLEGRQDTLNIHIDYFENPFCPQAIKIEAAELKAKSTKEYNHVYLGIPLDGASDYLFNYEKLENAIDLPIFGETRFPATSLGIDFAAHGDDQCVATLLRRVSSQHWQLDEQLPWDEPDAMVSTGKIVDMIGRIKPTAAILDVGGMGHVVYNRLSELGVNIQRFDGASINGVDTKHYVNARAHGYYLLSEWFDQGFLSIPNHHRQVLKELKKIRMKFRSDGRRLLQPKVDMKRELGFSPDYADSLMMAVWAAKMFIGTADKELSAGNTSKIVRKTGTNRTGRRTSRTPRTHLR